MSRAQARALGELWREAWRRAGCAWPHLGADLSHFRRQAAGHAGILPIACDVSDPLALTKAFAQVRAELGPVLLLINNAAVYPRRDVFEDSQASFMATVATNLGGTFGATRLALEDMADAGFGRIVNVTSFADIAPLPASGAYSVSKGAQRILTRVLLADLSDRLPDIVISDWLPGMLATEMGIPDGLCSRSCGAVGREAGALA